MTPGDARPEAEAEPEPERSDDGGDDETLGHLSAGSFLREVAFAPHVEPPRPERDRTGQTLGRFQIAGVLGRGGMGVVYLALDLTLQRKIALKLLRAGAVEGPAQRRRFLAEARAAAAVNHPNIVAVFEAGEVDGDLFIAMELVDGADARAWLAARPRSRREIIKVFAMAGHGLAAAHRAGLVHRDFKPENVLIDATGRARVADFGLALGLAHDPDAAPGAPAIQPDPARHEPRLTQPGTVMGTPGYIAPECLSGRDADARADQFAFCVALFEALEGHRPHGKPSAPARDPAEARPPRPRRTPLLLRGVLARGLAAHPGDRFPSMNALLARMERARIWPRRAAAAAALVAGAAALALWAGAARRAAPSCDTLAAEVPAAWLSARGPIREAFARAAVPYAADADDRVRLKLDAWTDHWSQARRAACGEPRSGANACLARQQRDLGAVLDLLRHADAQVVARAVTIVDELGDPARCLEGAGALAPAPASDEADGVSRRIAEARALISAGKYADAAALGAALRRDAKGVPAIEADAFAAAAVASWKAGQPDALQALIEARWAAERARRDALSTELALSVSEAYRQQSERASADEWIGHAEATLARVGKDLRLESMVLAARAQLVGLMERQLAAHELALRALALREQALGRDHLEVAESLILAVSFTPPDKIEAGMALARRALEIRVAVLGPSHPDVAAVWERLGQLYRARHDAPREIEVQEHALRIRLAALGPDHPEVARSHWALGNVLAVLGQDAAALARFRRAREILDRSHGSGSVRAGVLDLMIAEIEARLGDVELALARSRAAIAQIERTLGSDSPFTALELCMLADLLVQHGERTEAEALYTRALRNVERRDLEVAKASLPLVGLSKLARLRGQPGAARNAAERALRAGATLYPPDDPDLLPEYHALFQAALAAGELEETGRQAAHLQAVANARLAADDPLRLEIQQAQALLASARGERAEAVTLARRALDAQRTRPWQVLRLAEAEVVLACALGPRDAEAARLRRDAVGRLRAAKAFGSADAASARCR